VQLLRPSLLPGEVFELSFQKVSDATMYRGKFPLRETMETKSKAAATLMSFTSDSRLTSSIIFYYSKSS
jgi:hypothetical protein